MSLYPFVFFALLTRFCQAAISASVAGRRSPTIPSRRIPGAIENFPERTACVPGQHDLPYHSMERIDRSSINLISNATNIEIINGGYLYEDELVLFGFPFGSKITSEPKKYKEESYHAAVYINSVGPLYSVDINNVLKNSYSILRDKGIIILVTPNGKYIKQNFKKHFQYILSGKKKYNDPLDIIPTRTELLRKMPKGVVSGQSKKKEISSTVLGSI